MERSKAFFVTFFLMGAFLLFQVSGSASDRQGEDVRRSILQGAWYPDDRESLEKAVHGYLKEVNKNEIRGRIRGLVVPHAGYRYSGPVAAHAYESLRGSGVKRVVLIGPSHRFGFEGVSVSLHDAYETPLGRVRVDRDFARKLTVADKSIRFIRQAHAKEHSLEIQLPFLQCVLDDFSIVTLLMGRQDMETCALLAAHLADAVGPDPGTIIVASTDLSHYHRDGAARRLDGTFRDYVQKFDPQGLFNALSSGTCEACGGGPTIAAMLASKRLGADRSVILRYATSGDVTGDREKVVGYLAAALVTAPEE